MRIFVLLLLAFASPAFACLDQVNSVLPGAAEKQLEKMIVNRAAKSGIAIRQLKVSMTPSRNFQAGRVSHHGFLGRSLMNVSGAGVTKKGTPLFIRAEREREGLSIVTYVSLDQEGNWNGCKYYFDNFGGGNIWVVNADAGVLLTYFNPAGFDDLSRIRVK